MNWQRWRDGYGASYCYFEAHKGKNVSDTIGSIVKCAFIKAIIKENEGF